MNALTPITIERLPALVDADLDAADDYLRAEKSPGTRRAYASDYRIFVRYCADRGACAMPAGRNEPPTNSEAVKAVIRGIRRSIGTAKTQKVPATADLVRQMLDACPDTMRGKRDRALLALGFAGAFRRSELVALTVADLVEAPDGCRITIRHSKTDQEGAGQEIAVPRGSRLRPVEMVQTWLTAAGITEGPVFRQVNRGGRVDAAALGAGSVADLVKECAARVGLDATTFAAHSLRSGFLTSGTEHGASVLKLMEVSRHKSVDVLSGYVRRSDMFRDHAGSTFL